MIELQHLTKQYGEQVAVRDLSLTVGEGELLVLLGGSGSGKTTTLKMINKGTDELPGWSARSENGVCYYPGNSRSACFLSKSGRVAARPLINSTNRLVGRALFSPLRAQR